MNEIRRPDGTVLASYADGVSLTWPSGQAPTGEIVFLHSEDDGETWQEFLRGQYVIRTERVQRFVPA